MSKDGSSFERLHCRRLQRKEHRVPLSDDVDEERKKKARDWP